MVSGELPAVLVPVAIRLARTGDWKSNCPEAVAVRPMIEESETRRQRKMGETNLEC